MSILSFGRERGRKVASVCDHPTHLYSFYMPSLHGQEQLYQFSKPYIVTSGRMDTLFNDAC
jgi:hypothetical protein